MWWLVRRSRELESWLGAKKTQKQADKKRHDDSATLLSNAERAWVQFRRDLWSSGLPSVFRNAAVSVKKTSAMTRQHMEAAWLFSDSLAVATLTGELARRALDLADRIEQASSTRRQSSVLAPFIACLPKAHLHAHLEGSISARLLYQWLVAVSVVWPDAARHISKFFCGDDIDTLWTRRGAARKAHANVRGNHTAARGH